MRVLGATPPIPGYPSPAGTGTPAWQPQTAVEVVVAALLDCNRPDLAALIREGREGTPTAHMAVLDGIHEPDATLMRRALMLGCLFDRVDRFAQV